MLADWDSANMGELGQKITSRTTDFVGAEKTPGRTGKFWCIGCCIPCGFATLRKILSGRPAPAISIACNSGRFLYFCCLKIFEVCRLADKARKLKTTPQ